MATTTNLGMTLVEQSQAQKEVTINEAFSLLDAVAGMNVLDKDLSAPPTTPLPSRLYIVGPSPTGAWAGKTNALAYFDQLWRFITPQTAMRVWVADEAADYRYDGSGWVIIATGGGGGGGISGPGTSTSTAIALWNSTTGAALSNSLVTIDGSGNMAGVGTVSSGATTIAGSFAQTGSASSTAATVRHRFTGAADTALTASTEATNVHFNLGQTRQHATGALALQRDYRITPSTHSFVAASALTDAYGIYIDGAPIAGTNATITNSYSLGLGASAVGSGVTNSYGLVVNPNTGAANNYGAWLKGTTLIDNFRGSQTNDSASAGCVGEYASATLLAGSAITASNGVVANVVSVSLTAGDWDVEGVVAFTCAASTSVVARVCSISQTSAAHSTAGAVGYNALVLAANVNGGNAMTLPTGRVRVSLASTTTIYLVAHQVFSVSTAGAYGQITARRMR